MKSGPGGPEKQAWSALLDFPEAVRQRKADQRSRKSKFGPLGDAAVPPGQSETSGRVKLKEADRRRGPSAEQKLQQEGDPMKRALQRQLKSGTFICALWVGLCFTLTSAIYLAWVYRLVAVTGNRMTDWISMVAGYLCQALGIGLTMFQLRGSEQHFGRENSLFPRRFLLAIAALILFAVPSLFEVTRAGVICFGMIMNLVCGIISGFYLFVIQVFAEEQHRGIVFGTGYAFSSIALGIWSFALGGSLRNGKTAMPVCMMLALLLLVVTYRAHIFESERTTAAVTEHAMTGVEEGEAQQEEGKAQQVPRLSGQTPCASSQLSDVTSRSIILFSCFTVILISMVKNLGFAFPSSDIEAGLLPELSRIAYAAGLIIAGLVIDRDRKNGMLCTVSALVIPFVMLGLSGEPVSRTLIWGLGYLFTGFFSVFRVVLFFDIAARYRMPQLAPLGLLTGRVGDAAGTGISLLLAGQKPAMVAVTVLLFIPTVFILSALYRKLYEPETIVQRDEQEIFRTFCLHNDLSSRESDVLRLVLSEQTNGEIAGALFISESTVKYHVRNVLQKTGCKNRKELQRMYLSALYPQGVSAGAEGQEAPGRV